MNTALKSIAALLLAAALSPAQAAIQTFTGTDVIYSIDFDQEWLEGLTASVSGNTLTFSSSNGGAIAESNAKGKGSYEANVTFQSPNWQFNGVTAQAKFGKGITGFNTSFDAKVNGAVKGSNSSIRGNQYATIHGYAVNEDVDAWASTYSSSVINGTNNGYTALGKLKDEGTYIGSFGYATTGRVEFSFLHQVGVGNDNSIGNNSFASASLNSFGVTTQVAPVPEPETYALMGMGLVGLLAARRRKLAK